MILKLLLYLILYNHVKKGINSKFVTSAEENEVGQMANSTETGEIW